MASPTATAIELPAMPKWLEEMMAWRVGGAASQFILHFNINDYVLPSSQDRPVLPLRTYLYRWLLELDYKAIFYYSRSTGIIADDSLGDFRFGQMRTGTGMQARGQAGPGPISERLLEDHRRRLNQHQSRGTPSQADTGLMPLLVLESILRENEPNSAVIIDYLEKIAPHNAGEGQGNPEEMISLEILQRWPLDSRIRATDNIIIMLTDNLGQVATPLHASGSGTHPIKVDLPRSNERATFIRRLANPTKSDLDRNMQPMIALGEDLLPAPDPRTDASSSPDERKLQVLITETQGMRLVDIDNLSRTIYATTELARIQRQSSSEKQGHQEAAEITLKDVREAKVKIIKAQTQELLEVVTPSSSFADVGGLDKVKQYLEGQVRLLRDREQKKSAIRGLILAGPPGTGKSILAEALAKSSNLSMVKMRDIRSKWVGESEQNLSKVLDVIVALAPVVVFIDEIDQAIGQRDTGSSGDSGTSARMFGRILEFMGSNDHRGDVVWIGASNRPDLLDAAMLRRFDRIVPLLLPGEAERRRIFEVMPRQIVPEGNPARKNEVFYAADTDLDHIARETKGLTGAAIEMIVRRAREIAHNQAVTTQHLLAARQDFKPNHDQQMYDLQSMIALAQSNFYSVMPVMPKEFPYDVEPYSSFIEEYGDPPKISPEKLNAKIAQYLARPRVP